MRVLFSLLILFTPFLVNSQDMGIEVVGEIVDAETKEPIPFVHIIKKDSNKGTASNSEGRFWINSHPGDTLLFSAIGFEIYQFILNEDIKTNKLLVTIELSQSTLELETVKVFAFKDEYALKRAILDTEVSLEDENKKGIQLPGFYYGPRKEWKNSVITSPLTAIAGVFSKENKERKLLENAKRQTASFYKIDSKYNEAVVKEITGLPEDKVEDFMAFCIIDQGYIEKATEYELAVVINRCLADFNKQEK